MDKQELNTLNIKYLTEMYNIFKDNIKQEDNKDIDTMFLEMMSDYKTFNNLMYIVSNIEDKLFEGINEDLTGHDKIEKNIRIFGKSYQKVYNSFNAFIK